MFCNTCGINNADSARFCVNCGTSMVAPTVVVNPAQVMGAGTAPAPAPVQSQQPVAPQPQNPWLAVPPPMTQPTRTSGKAVASLILGIVNALFLFIVFPIGILAIVFGHLGRNEVKQSNGAVDGGGMAMAGLVLGYMGVAGIPFILIVAAIAIPNLLSARVSANESSAVGGLRTINTALVSYNAQYPRRGYPTSLRELGPAAPGQPESEDGAGFIDDRLASGTRSGYTFTYLPGPLDENGTITGYTVYADPVNPNTGHRHFFTDTSAVIRVETTGPANENSPPLQ